MNTFTALLVVVVVAAVAPVQGRSTLSRVLDVVGELETSDFGDLKIPEFNEERVNKALYNMQILFDTTRQVIEEASQPGALQPAGPNALAQLELMERVIPLSINIVADLAKKTDEDPFLEPALPDFTGSAQSSGKSARRPSFP